VPHTNVCYLWYVRGVAYTSEYENQELEYFLHETGILFIQEDMSYQFSWILFRISFQRIRPIPKL
jgi:hypothetical protein